MLEEQGSHTKSIVLSETPIETYARLNKWMQASMLQVAGVSAVQHLNAAARGRPCEDEPALARLRASALGGKRTSISVAHQLFAAGKYIGVELAGHSGRQGGQVHLTAKYGPADTPTARARKGS
jgi:hypothetical protein